MLELWEMWSAPSLPLQSMGQIELFDIYHIIFTNPSARAGYDTRSIFKRSLTGLNSEFSFCLTFMLSANKWLMLN